MAVLKNLSLSELLNICNSDFYDIIKNKDEFFEYLKTLSYKVCDRYNIVDYPFFIADNSSNKIQIGTYKVNPPTIIINGLLIESFDKFKNIQNLYYPFLLITATLHETRHFLQHNSNRDIDPIVKKYTAYRPCSPIDIYKYISYGTEVAEIDARYFAYQALKGKGIFDRFIYSNESIAEESERSKEISSVARLLDESLKSYISLLPKTKVVLFDMNSTYNYFLYDIGIDRSAFKRKSINELSQQESESLNEKLNSQKDMLAEFLRYYSSIILHAEHGRSKPLKEILKLSNSELCKFTSISEAQKREVSKIINLKALSKYETDKLYERIAPEFSNLVKKGFSNKSLSEIDEFKDIFNELKPN